MSHTTGNGVVSPKNTNLTPQQRIEQLQNELVTTIKERDEARERCETIRGKVQKYRTQKEDQISELEDQLKKTTRLRDLYQKDLVTIRGEYRNYKETSESRIKELSNNLQLMTHTSNKYQSEVDTLHNEMKKLQDKIDKASFVLPDIVTLNDNEDDNNNNDEKNEETENGNGNENNGNRKEASMTPKSPITAADTPTKPLSEQINWTPNKSKKLVNAGVDMSEFACEQTESTERVLNQHTKILNEWKITSNILDSIYNLTNSSSIIDLSLNINLNDANNENNENDDSKQLENVASNNNNNNNNNNSSDGNIEDVNKSERLFSKYLICKKLINQTHHRLESMQTNVIALFDQRRELMQRVGHYDKEMTELTNELSKVTNEYDTIHNKRVSIQSKLESLVAECSDLILKENTLCESKHKIDKNRARIENELRLYQKILNRCQSLMSDYQTFEDNNHEYIPMIEKYFDKEWAIFESKWSDWNGKDILTWIKYKMKWNHTQDITINLNTNDSNEPTTIATTAAALLPNAAMQVLNNSSISSIIKQDDTLTIMLSNVEKNIKEMNLNGESLLNVDKPFLLKLGITNYEHRNEIYKHIRHLCETYPQSDSDIPERFLCPITKQVMDDPVIAFDNHTYEREAILSYLKEHHKSPITDQECGNDKGSSMVFRNLKLKQEIDAFKAVRSKLESTQE